MEVTMMIRKRSLGFIAAALAAAGATTAICCSEAVGLAPERMATFGNDLPPAPLGSTPQPLGVLGGAKTWLTAVPGGPRSLRGKVVIVNFWTYSCINSLRALPYLKAWNERYASKGLVVVGVHAPEFQFEHDPAKVRLASRQLGVSYPNLQDNAFAVWQDFANRGWPGFYFIDVQGRVRGYRIGEGDYDSAEQLIRKLLAEGGHDPADISLTPIAGAGIQAAADWRDLRSPEAYVGYSKAVSFRSPGGLRRDEPSTYSAASDLPLNSWDLTGKWTIGREFAALDAAEGTIRFRFHARDAHLVLGSAPDHRPVRFRVTIDGAAPGANHGAEVDAQGWGEVKEDRLYQLVRQRGAIGDRTIKVQFSRPGVRAYVFTFG
jgi:thiol-disulfide isomerase/thioredoxin